MMEIEGIDHFVITTGDLAACLDFYGKLLGLPIDAKNGRYAIRLGARKINIHTRPGEFQPAAASPAPGTQDFCLTVRGDIRAIRDDLVSRGADVTLGPVLRHGARGEMDSIYLRDPDGNLVELAVYR